MLTLYFIYIIISITISCIFFIFFILIKQKYDKIYYLIVNNKYRNHILNDEIRIFYTQNQLDHQQSLIENAYQQYRVIPKLFFSIIIYDIIMLFSILFLVFRSTSELLEYTVNLQLVINVNNIGTNPQYNDLFLVVISYLSNVALFAIIFLLLKLVIFYVIGIFSANKKLEKILNFIK